MKSMKPKEYQGFLHEFHSNIVELQKNSMNFKMNLEYLRFEFNLIFLLIRGYVICERSLIFCQKIKMQKFFCLFSF